MNDVLSFILGLIGLIAISGWVVYFGYRLIARWRSPSRWMIRVGKKSQKALKRQLTSEERHAELIQDIKTEIPKIARTVVDDAADLESVLRSMRHKERGEFLLSNRFLASVTEYVLEDLQIALIKIQDNSPRPLQMVVFDDGQGKIVRWYPRNDD